MTKPFQSFKTIPNHQESLGHESGEPMDLLGAWNFATAPN